MTLHEVWYILAATIASIIVGFLYYSPLVVGKKWMKLNGWDPNDKHQQEKMQKEGKRYLLPLVVMSLIAATALMILFRWVGVLSIHDAFKVAFVVWFGFIVTSRYNDVLFAKKPKELFAIDVGFQLISLHLMALILAFA